MKKKVKTPRVDESQNFNSVICDTIIQGDESEDLGVIERDQISAEAFVDEPTIEEVRDNQEDELVIEDIDEPMIDLYISHRSKKKKEKESILMVYDEPTDMNKHRKTLKKVPYSKNENIKIKIVGEDEEMHGPP